MLSFLVSLKGYAQDNQKLAQSGFQFLSVVSDARGAAMAEAMTSLNTGSSSLFFNPAGMAKMENMIDISLSTNRWIADINHYTVGMAYNPVKGRFGVFGVSIQSVDYGDFIGTRIDQSSPKGYYDTNIFSLSAMAIGFGYARQLTDRFAIGGQIKLVHQDLGESVIPAVIEENDSSKVVSNKLSPLVVDFGTQFGTGFKSLVFGMSIRNFSQEVKYAEEGFQAPLIFTLGISMNIFDFMPTYSIDQSMFISMDASHHRDHPEQIKIGMDYQFMEILSLRGGYISGNDESGFSFGLGISHSGLSIDYAYTPYGIWDKVQRLTGRFAF